MTGANDDPKGDDDQALQRRLQDLKRDLASGREASPRPDPTPLALGMRGASEFAVAVFLGGAIGLGIDHFAGTRPLFAILFFFLGVAAGVFSVVRETMPKRPK